MEALGVAVSYVALFWIVAVGPFIAITMLTALVHGRQYSFSITDWVLGLAVFVLLAHGMPPLAI